jgi:hypothetical protein
LFYAVIGTGIQIIRVPVITLFIRIEGSISTARTFRDTAVIFTAVSRHSIPVVALLTHRHLRDPVPASFNKTLVAASVIIQPVPVITLLRRL